MSRHFLRSICRLLISVVLLAQMAVSAYACPGLSGSKMQMSPATAMAGDQSGVPDGAAAQAMANCDDMVGAVDPSFGRACQAST